MWFGDKTHTIATPSEATPLSHLLSPLASGRCTHCLPPRLSSGLLSCCPRLPSTPPSGPASPDTRTVWLESCIAVMCVCSRMAVMCVFKNGSDVCVFKNGSDVCVFKNGSDVCVCVFKCVYKCMFSVV